MRLPNGYGSVHKLGGKRRKPWRARVTIGWTDNGKQIFKNLGCFESQIEAIHQLDLYNTNPYLIDNKNITFKEIYDKWSEEKFKVLSNTSIDGYINAFNYCEDIWNIPFEQIKLNALQKIINKADGKLATQKKIKGLMGILYDYGIANDVVLKKYSDYLILGEQKDVIIRIPFSEAQIDILWKNIDNIKSIDIVLILIYTGMRIGELIKMEKNNVFLEENYMIGGSKTKAGKNRIIPIHKRIKPIIEKWYNQTDSKYLICNTVGKKLEYTNFKGRDWKEIMDTLQFNHNPHDTRHTFATRMDDVGANKVCTKMILGHANSDLTEKVYTHKTKEKLLEAVNLLR